MLSCPHVERNRKSRCVNRLVKCVRCVNRMAIVILDYILYVLSLTLLTNIFAGDF